MRAPVDTQGDPPQVDVQAFCIEGGQVGCLLIHGFTATPYDMRFLAEELSRDGVTTHAPCLPGHATTPEEMATTGWNDWYEAVVKELHELRAQTEKVMVVGQSMGALLALKLAVDEKESVDALGLLATALILSQPWLQKIAPVIPGMLRVLPKRAHFTDKGDSDIADEEERAKTPTYRKVPLRAVSEFVNLQKLVRPIIPRVHQPTLIIHSKQDHTCPIENVVLLEKELAGISRTVLLEESYHVLSIDVERRRIAEELRAFVAEHLTGSSAASQEA